MRIEQPVEFQPYAAHFAALLIATLLTRCTAAPEVGAALGSAALWAAAFFVCWNLRGPLRARRWATITPQWAGEAVAAIGMLIFVATLLGDGVLPALGALVCALTAAMLVVAERRAHLLLIVAMCLTQVLMTAAASRSGWFVPCAAFFTLAVLSLFAFDLGACLRGAAAATPLGKRPAAHGGALVTLLVMLIALPLYLYVPQPPALYLGGRSATSTHDYSDPRGPSSTQDARDGRSERSHGAAADSAPPSPDDSGRGVPGNNPRGRYGDADTRDTNAQSGSELSVSGVKREAALANVIVMFVKTTHPVYLRSKLFDRFSGDRWQRSGATPTPAPLHEGYLRLGTADNGTHITQQIDIAADLDESALAASAAATQIRFPGPLLYDNGDGTFAAPRPLRKDTGYSVDASPHLLGSRYADDGPPPDARYLQIDGAISARVRELAKSVTANAADAWHKALAIEDHLRANYQYSYETIVPYQGRTPLDWFLFENRKGHCEFFASAMVVMLREIGIPARLANGFSLGERNPLTGYYEVRVLDGHAWPEAWIDGRWVMFEPTPFYPLPQQRDDAQRQVAGATDRYLERLADTSTRLSPQSLRASLLQAVRDAWSSARHLQRVFVAWFERVLPWLPLMIVLLLLAWAAQVLGLQAWRDARERADVARLLDLAQRDQPRAVVHLAQAVERALASRGAPRAAALTMREYCRVLHAAAIALPEDFADAFDAVRYGAGTAPGFAAQGAAIAQLLNTRVAAQRHPRMHAVLQRWLARVRRRHIAAPFNAGELRR